MKNLISLSGCIAVIGLFACTTKNEDKRVPQGVPEGAEKAGSLQSEMPSGSFLTPSDFTGFVYTPLADFPNSLLDSHRPFFENPWFLAKEVLDANRENYLKSFNWAFEVRDKDTVVLSTVEKYYYDPNHIGEQDGSLVQTSKFSVPYEKKSFSMVTCTDIDLSEFNGKLWAGNSSIFLSKEIAARCEGAKTIKFLQNTAKDFINDKYKTAISDAEGKPCILSKDGNSYKLNNCYVRHVEHFNLGDMESKNSHELKCVNLVADNSGHWYSSGQIEAKINNYSGLLTYTSAAQAPTYDVTNGTKKASGKISEK